MTESNNQREQTVKNLDADSQEQQAELRRRYNEQQARRACPGCGEEPFRG